MGEDLLDHWRFQDRRDDLQLAAAVRAMLHVDLEHALEQPSPDTNSPVDCLCLARGLATGQARPARGRGTSAASRCMNSSGDITRCVVPSRQGVFNLSTTCPAALVCTRSLANAEPGHKQSGGLFVPGEEPG